MFRRQKVASSLVAGDKKLKQKARSVSAFTTGKSGQNGFMPRLDS
jgi:hypothetical protein